MASQSRTRANDKAAAAEAMPKLKGNVIPGGGNSYQDNGGPTNTDYKADDDSAKLNHHAPGQSKTRANDKGGAPAAVGGGVDGKTSIKDHGYGGVSHDGTNSGRSNEGGKKLGKEVSYEHAEVDETAGEQLDELSDAQGASDDFKERAKVIFEAALNQKLQTEVARLEEEFSQRFEEEISDIAEKVESFLNYTSQQWLEENRLVVENGIRNELSESFMQGLRGLFEDHYVTLPDEKYDIFESMVAKLDDMEDKLNEQIETNVALNQKIGDLVRESVVNDVAWDLSEAGRERLAGLAENVEFESEDTFKQKLEILKESFAGPSQEEPAEYLEESFEPAESSLEDEYGDSMAAYARALSRTVR